ncbi:histone deacetylase family protein [Desulfogranum mediterraneum]|uniref:histone deacetylase family protein n=1 Tax=Desulfogranum mediterraneum TaxID=160661 RepID=UPI000409DFD9|nr:histone deacetylase [Desulfogranum mediterraneum]
MSMAKPPGILLDRRYFQHKINRPSPENADRVKSLYTVLEAAPYASKLRLVTPREATASEVAAVHSDFYLDQLREHLNLADPYSYDQDTYLMEQSLYTAHLAAGGCLELSDRILSGELDYGFALIRPPGHHAEAGRGMGFCVLNNVAIVAEYLCRVYGLQRLLIVDFDVHHCNGTQSIFYDSDQVLVLSIHQERLFPFSGSFDEVGSEQGRGYTINLPVFGQFGDQEYSFLLGQVLGTVAEQYLPQMILVSAGYDGHQEESISKTLLSTQWYGIITTLLKVLAREVCENRLLFVLEGGYNPESLERSVLATVDALLEPVAARPGFVYSQRAARVLADHPLHHYWTL